MKRPWQTIQPLLTPGPMPISRVAKRVMNGVEIHHRTEEYAALLAANIELFQRLHETATAHTFFFRAGGTEAMEIPAINVLVPSAQRGALVLNAGKFGDRFEEICWRKDVIPDRVRAEPGIHIDPSKVEDALRQKNNYQAIFLQVADTSTGILNDVETLVRVIRQYTDALIIADAVLETGVSKIPIGEWGVDIIVGAGHKALMLPSGIGFVTIRSPEVIERIAEIHKVKSIPILSWDLVEEYKENQRGWTRFTPPIQAMAGLYYVISKIMKKGPERVYARYEALAHFVRDEFRARGFGLFPRGRMTNALTIVSLEKTPYSADDLMKRLAAHDEHVARGQGIKDVFRIAHCGSITQKRLERFFKNFDTVCREMR